MIDVMMCDKSFFSLIEVGLFRLVEGEKVILVIVYSVF